MVGNESYRSSHGSTYHLQPRFNCVREDNQETTLRNTSASREAKEDHVCDVHIQLKEANNNKYMGNFRDPTSSPSGLSTSTGPLKRSLESAPEKSFKRKRRKCSVAHCENRVVQGGLCISHGAKRKSCSHPGCDKNVKKAGLCSAHGPARKRCEVPDCVKVAVQGGKCIAHGAKKKLCKVNQCTKQAILRGMCKKHHDEISGNSKKSKKDVPPVSEIHVIKNDLNVHIAGIPICTVINEGKTQSGETAGKSPVPNTSSSSKATLPKAQNQFLSNSTVKKGHHKRGLSVFHDINAVDTIIHQNPIPRQSNNMPTSRENSVVQDDKRISSTDQRNTDKNDGIRDPKKYSRHRRGLSIFTEHEVAENIIKKNIII